MWRNGRRNGLKIRFYESGVWVRVPPSAPCEKAFYEGKCALCCAPEKTTLGLQDVSHV
jgi:hypothetical protein